MFYSQVTGCVQIFPALPEFVPTLSDGIAGIRFMVRTLLSANTRQHRHHHNHMEIWVNILFTEISFLLIEKKMLQNIRPRLVRLNLRVVYTLGGERILGASTARSQTRYLTFCIF